MIGALVPVLRIRCVAPFSMVLRNSVGRIVDSAVRQQSLDEIRDLVPCRIDDAQVFKPGLRCVQRCRRNIHAHESLGWNLERLRVTPFVRIECQTRLRSD